ncbi:Uncharacterised protein [Mycobacteroides abscessus subsp. abscessus]|nr:Uncharacterised protein [Mycobacteroides abscessus subsp. abscessus]
MGGTRCPPDPTTSHSHSSTESMTRAVDRCWRPDPTIRPDSWARSGPRSRSRVGGRTSRLAATALRPRRLSIGGQARSSEPPPVSGKATCVSLPGTRYAKPRRQQPFGRHVEGVSEYPDHQDDGHDLIVSKLISGIEHLVAQT